MPPHLIHEDLPPKRKKTKPKNWHPWMQEVQCRNRVRKLKLIAATLGVNAVVASDDDEDHHLD
jgi:hypothetical protein